MKRLFSLLCATVMLFAFPAEISVLAADFAETFGADITWNYDADTRTLYLSGMGATETGFMMPKQAPVQMLSAETLDEWENRTWNEISGQVQHIVIGEGITDIADQAFCLFPELESVTLPDSVEQVGSWAFGGCPKLKKLQNVPDTAEISHDAFLYDTELYGTDDHYLILNGWRLISYNGTGAEEVTVPEQITRINVYAFEGHAELKRIRLPGGLREIGSYAFVDCAGLTDMTVPEGVEQIEAYTFSNCTSLQTVQLPNALTAIRSGAFYNCTALRDMVIPDTVQTVGEDAFVNNPWLDHSGDLVILGEGILCRAQGRGKIIVLPENVKQIIKDAISGSQIVEIQLPETAVLIDEGAIHCERAVIAGAAGGIAEAFAAKHHLPFRDLNASAPQGDDLTIDCAKDGWYFGNSGDVFGGDYYLTDADRQHLEALGISTQGVDQDWGGSCVGLSLTVILAKTGYFHPSELQSGAETLSDVEPTDAVRSFINYYQCTQGRNGTVTGTTDFQKIYNMSLRLPDVQHGESPFLLTFATETGSHGVVAYGLEKGAWVYGDKGYDRRILVWDSNCPDALHDDSCLYYDSRTLDFCIPGYGVHVADGAGDNTAGLIAATNDLSVLNAYPYPLPDAAAGDLNLDGSVTIADAVLLARYLSAQSTLSDRARRAADLSGDKRLDAADLTLLKRKLL